MNERAEILCQLREVRTKIAFTPISKEREELVIFAEKLHNDYKANLFEEKMQQKKKGR